MIRPFGERALLVELDGSDAARLLDSDLRREPPAGVVATVPGLASVLVELDPAVGPSVRVASDLEARVASLAGADIGNSAPGRQRTIPVVYGGEHGPDLPEVAALTGLAEDEIIDRHAGLELRVLFLGFAPGFAYLGDMPEELRAPRLGSPRTLTPAGSVGIAGSMTGIYPAALPGGWRVIGRTPALLFDPRRDPPAYLDPGDSIRFEPIPASAWDERAGAPSDW